MQPASPLTAQPPPLTAPRLMLGSITSKGNNLPNRYILHAVEGYGKTSLAAQFPKPVFIQSRGETGLETLIDAGRLPETPHFPEITDWAVLLEAIRMLTTEKHDYKTLVIDTMNGVERLCHEFVCRRDFGNNWGERGFEGYKRGYEIALTDWRSFLQLLDSLREQRRMIVMLLCHTKVKTFNNPEGANYDRWAPDVHEKTWGLSHKWADVVLFGNFLSVGDKDRKGAGGKDRMLYCEQSAAVIAKNRIGLPAEMQLPSDSPYAAYAAFLEAVKAGRGTNAAGGTVTAASQGGN